MASTAFFKSSGRPITPGSVLRDEFLARHGITQDVLAAAMGMSRLTVNQLINGRRAITAETAVRLGKALGTSPEFWLNLQRSVDLYEAEENLKASVAKIRVLID